MPSSRAARTTRSAISPRLATRIFWIIRSLRLRFGFRLRFERLPRLVRRGVDALHAELELGGIRRVAKRALEADLLLGVEAHDGLIEGLHPVLRHAVRDGARDERGLLGIPEVLADRRGHEHHFARRHTAR